MPATGTASDCQLSRPVPRTGWRQLRGCVFDEPYFSLKTLLLVNFIPSLDLPSTAFLLPLQILPMN